MTNNISYYSEWKEIKANIHSHLRRADWQYLSVQAAYGIGTLYAASQHNLGIMWLGIALQVMFIIVGMYGDKL